MPCSVNNILTGVKNIRMEEEREIRRLRSLYIRFLEEKQQFLEEMKELNKKIYEGRKRLKEVERFFVKKMVILKGGFAQLEAARKAIERDKIRLEAEREAMSRRIGCEDSIRLFFKGVSNPLTLKKRYRDLTKIFHPDNVCGDTEMLQSITKAYHELQEEMEWQKKA